MAGNWAKPVMCKSCIFRIQNFGKLVPKPVRNAFESDLCLQMERGGGGGQNGSKPTHPAKDQNPDKNKNFWPIGSIFNTQMAHSFPKSSALSAPKHRKNVHFESWIGKNVRKNGAGTKTQNFGSLLGTPQKTKFWGVYPKPKTHPCQRFGLW